MFTTSTIDIATRQSYLETHYHVLGQPPFTLEVGIADVTLTKQYKAHRVESCAFITACNPFSQSLEKSVNADLHAALARGLRQRSLMFEEGLGEHPSNQWPSEASYLVWDLSLEVAKTLGIKHDQNAIIWCGSDAVPQLILLR